MMVRLRHFNLNDSCIAYYGSNSLPSDGNYCEYVNANGFSYRAAAQL